MERFSKGVFIALLLFISFSASLFMILESGSFFQQLYTTENSFSFMGYWAAFLNEVFMGIMAGVWLPGKTTKKGMQPHPANFLFKSLLIFLFLTTVCGSSMKTVYPLIETIQNQKNQEKVMRVLKSQAEDNERSLRTFEKQNQKTNSALTVRNQTKTKEEMKKLFSQQQSSFSLWIQIVTVILLRFGVQMANLCCIWLVGWIYTRPGKTVKEKTSEENKHRNRLKIEDKKTIDTDPALQVLATKKAKADDRPTEAKSKEKSNEPRRTHSAEVAVGGSSSRTARIKTATLTQRKVTDSSNSMLETLKIKNRISQLLQSRNEGISLSQIGKAIGEKEANLRDIVNPRITLNSRQIPALENILLKIERLYQEESIRYS